MAAGVADSQPGFLVGTVGERGAVGVDLDAEDDDEVAGGDLGETMLADGAPGLANSSAAAGMELAAGVGITPTGV